MDAGNRTTDDLIRIAAAAGRAPIHLRGMNHFSTDDLIKIGVAGKGTVVFE